MQHIQSATSLMFILFLISVTQDQTLADNAGRRRGEELKSRGCGFLELLNPRRLRSNLNTLGIDVRLNRAAQRIGELKDEIGAVASPQNARSIIEYELGDSLAAGRIGNAFIEIGDTNPTEKDIYEVLSQNPKTLAQMLISEVTHAGYGCSKLFCVVVFATVGDPEPGNCNGEWDDDMAESFGAAYVDDDFDSTDKSPISDSSDSPWDGDEDGYSLKETRPSKRPGERSRPSPAPYDESCSPADNRPPPACPSCKSKKKCKPPRQKKCPNNVSVAFNSQDPIDDQIVVLQQLISSLQDRLLGLVALQQNSTIAVQPNSGM